MIDEKGMILDVKEDGTHIHTKWSLLVALINLFLLIEQVMLEQSFWCRVHKVTRLGEDVYVQRKHIDTIQSQSSEYTVEPLSCRTEGSVLIK